MLQRKSVICSVTKYHPTAVSPKEHLCEQLASNPAFTERSTQKANPYLLQSCPEENSLITYHTLPSFYIVFGLSTLWPQQRRLLLR